MPGGRSAPLALLAGVALAQNACLQPGVRCGSGEEHARVNTVGLRGQRRRQARNWTQPRRCPMTNMSHIEDLWPEQHFRGPLYGPNSYFRRVPQHYLGHHADFSRCRRRVYLDIGAGQFDASGSSEGFVSMLKLYPPLVDFDEFYSFEAVPGRYRLPPERQLQQLLRRSGMSAERARTFSRRHFFLQAFAGARSDTSTTPPTVGVSDMLLTMLHLQPADAVVIKMDAEGYEYEIVETLLADGTVDLVDEVMLEVHYRHPKMEAMFKWCRTPQFWCRYTLTNATAMFQSLRDAQVYAHSWP